MGSTQVHYIHCAFSPYSLQKSYLRMQVQGTCCVRIGTLSADFSLSVQNFKVLSFKGSTDHLKRSQMIMHRQEGSVDQV